MSKHAVADLGQRAQTLAPAVENGGEEAEEKADSGSSSVGRRQLQAFLWQLLLPPSAITIDSKPSLLPPSPKIKCTFSLDSYFLKTTRKDKRNFSSLPVVKDNKASP